MSNGNRKAALALVAGIVLGAAVGWWLRGDAPVETPRTASVGPSSAPERRAAPSGRHERTVREGTTATETSRTEPIAAAVRGEDEKDPAVPTKPSAASPSKPLSAGERAKDAAPPAPKPAVADASAREARGVVLDATTQQPVTGARVLYAIVDGQGVSGWWGDTTGADGRFANRVHDDRDLTGVHFEVRVSKEGYEPVRVPAADGEYRVELRPRTTPLLPGRVAGLVRGADGKPVAGEIEVEGYDGEGSNIAQRTIADAGGAFVLDGMAPGPWRLHLEHGPMTECTVPEGGEARVELVGATDATRSGLTVTDIDPSKVKFDGDAAKERLAKLQGLLGEIASAPELDGASRERLQRAIAQEVQVLDAAALAAMPRREVVVTGLPTDERVWVRLETRPRHFWRAEASSGTARFAAVPASAYRVFVLRPGRPDWVHDVAVVAGDGPMEVAFR